MATFYERENADGTVMHCARVRVKAYPQTVKAFQRLRDAQRWAAKVEADMRSGVWRQTDKAAPTLGDCITRYRSEILPRLSASSISHQGLALTRWGAELGKVRLDSLTWDAILAARGVIAQRHSLGPPSEALLHAALARMLTVATTQWRILSVNPMAGMQKPSQGPGRERFLSKDELDRLMMAAAQVDERLHDVVLLLICSGMRRDEARFLTWAEVDFTQGVISLASSRTKTSRPRVIPLVGAALEMLRRRFEARISEYVFPAPCGAYAFGQLHFPKAAKMAGLPDVTPHVLRHSCASFLAQAGTPLLTISLILGHSSVLMSQRYSHLRTDDQRAALDGVMGGILNGKGDAS